MGRHIQVPHDMCKDGFLDYTDVLVYACLKSYMGSVTREAYPAVSTIIDKFGMSKNTIIRSIKRLVDHGDISIRKAGRRNIYKFDPDNRNF